MSESELQHELDELLAELQVPGAAVGVLHDGVEHCAYAGVTSVETPLAVDAATMFQMGSTSKTYTATALMRLVERGTVALDAPVRTYVPELALRDEDVARRVTVLHLLNHTAGWEGDLMEDVGVGDDALAKYVARMSGIEQVTPLGEAVSYNNASLSLAGRVIEKVTGTTYEQAIHDLLLQPLGMSGTFFFPNDVMTRRFCVGHERHEDGSVTVARPWAVPRGNAPAGGLTSPVPDLLSWAKFHLGDGTAADGTRLLQQEHLRQMQQPTAEMQGSALGDAVGIAWLLEDVAGARTVSHGGATNGQYSDFVLVPEHGFAVTSLVNSGPNGPQLNRRIVQWALEHYLGLVETEPEPVRLPDAELAAYTGRFETLAAVVDVRAADGRLSAAVTMKPAMAAALRESGDEPGEQPPLVMALLAGAPDRYVVDEGDARGLKGYFRRAADGTVDAVNLGGRLATRTGPLPG